MIALTPWLQGYSVVGGHGMFIQYFTHSEATWGLVFLSMGLLSQNRLASSSAMAGAVFSVNAFVGIWLFWANAFSLLYSRRQIDSARVARSIGAFILFASPAAVWIIFSIDGEWSSSRFSYIDYIRHYNPSHFLIEATSWRALVMFALVSVNGIVAAQYMLNRSYWVGVQLAFLLIFLVGVPLPYLLDDRFVFNLHLLRSAGVEQAVATILSAMAGGKLIMSAGSPRAQFLGALVLVSLVVLDCSISSLSVIALELSVGVFLSQDVASDSRSVVLERADRRAVVSFLLGLAMAGFSLVLVRQLMQQHVELTQLFLLMALISILGIFPYQELSVATKLKLFVLALSLCFVGMAAKNMNWYATTTNVQAVTSVDDSWAELVDWIRASPIHGVFLVSVSDKRSDGFQLRARRRVWVDWKQGAAVMWAPSFHNQWRRRFMEVSGLKTPDDFIRYAKDHGIGSVLLRSDDGTCPAASSTVMSNTHYILCSI